MGLERGGAGLLLGAPFAGPGGGSVRREGCRNDGGGGICPLDRQGPTVGRRPDPRRRRQLGAGKGLELNVASEPAARTPDPRWSRPGRRRAACPGPVIYGPGAKGAPTGPGVDYTQCASTYGSEVRRPHAPSRGLSPSSFVFLSPGSRERDTGRRLNSGSGQLAGHPISSLVDIRVAQARAQSAARGGGNLKRDTGRNLKRDTGRQRRLRL